MKPDSLSKINRTPYSWYNNDYENLSPAKRQLVRQNVNKFLRYINQGKTLRAKRILQNKALRMAKSFKPSLVLQAAVKPLPWLILLKGLTDLPL